MKSLPLFCMILLFHSQAFSQVSLGYFFPMGVMGMSYGDTLLNTSAVLKAARVRKIMAIQTSYTDLKTGFSPITTYLNANGKIEKVVYCMRRPPKPDSAICLNDTILYDNNGRMLQYISRDASGLAYLQGEADYSKDGKVKYTLIHASHYQSRNDTDISYHDYNERGQLVRVVYEYSNEKKLPPLSGAVYYNEDGLPDSIRHDNPAFGTYVFKRKQKGKNKEIQLETPTHYFKWVYDASGQCTSSQMGSKKQYTASRNNNPGYYAESLATYQYNGDGTLAKVLVKRDGKKVATLSYSYEK
jgi:hypothetical protein